MKTLFFYLSLSILIINWSCSSSSDGDGDGGTPSAVVTEIILADPYIFNGLAFWDKNKNSIWDPGEPISGLSDVNGLAKFDLVIPAGEIIGQHRAGTMDGFNYPGRLRGISIGDGTTVLNPMTTLLANGFTTDELLALFAEAGIFLTEEDLFKNPMTDPLVLQAALTLATGLIQNPKGFALGPGDTQPSANGLVMTNTYSQDFLVDSALIYGDVIEKVKDLTSIENISKTSSSFFDYLSRYGTDDFMNDDVLNENQVDDALVVIGDEFDNSTNALQPIVLLPEAQASPTDNRFSATVFKNVWFPPGDYDALGFRTLQANQRIVNESIGDYPQGPLILRILLMETIVTDDSFLYTFQRSKAQTEPWNYNIIWDFNSDTNQLTLVESLEQKNGDPPENVTLREELPIATSDFLTTLVYRTLEKNFDESTGLNDIFRLIGDGEKILTHYGIDWGLDPKNPLPWRTNTTRTNNCLTGNMEDRGLTNDCEGSDVAVKYTMIREGLSTHSVEALTKAQDLGASPNKLTFSFLYKNRSLSDPNTESPVEYIIRDIAAVEGQMDLTTECSVSNSCIQTNVDGFTRPPFDDTEDIDFFIGYEEFPSDYKVWAVNEIAIQLSGVGTISYETQETSSFYKMGFLVVQLKEITSGPFQTPFEYLIIDVASREGTAVSFAKDWIEDGVVKFRYRDFDKIEVKEITNTD